MKCDFPGLPKEDLSVFNLYQFEISFTPFDLSNSNTAMTTGNFWRDDEAKFHNPTLNLQGKIWVGPNLFEHPVVSL